jgi:perosamine synthetase
LLQAFQNNEALGDEALGDEALGDEAMGDEALGDTAQIPVYQPLLNGREREYVLDCVESGWVSSRGAYVGKFEAKLAQVLGVEHAISVCNGTAALHLALHCLGVGPGDEVIVPAFTYIASVATISQTGATPVFCESRADDWLIDVSKIEALITPRTRAIVPVHLFGGVCDMKAIMLIAKRHGLRVVEDCAECLGSTRDGLHPGTFGDIGTFSFFGNKTITTGEGGAVCTGDAALAARLAKVKNHGMSTTLRYWHDENGFNYRMTNIAAAIGLAQFERLDEILAMKRDIAARYRELMAAMPVTFQALGETTLSSEWLVSLLLPAAANRDAVMEAMQVLKVETRPVFYCAHHMPAYAEMARGLSLPVAEEISARGMSLPSFPGLTMRDQQRVVTALRQALAAQGIS